MRFSPCDVIFFLLMSLDGGSKREEKKKGLVRKGIHGCKRVAYKRKGDTSRGLLRTNLKYFVISIIFGYRSGCLRLGWSLWAKIITAIRARARHRPERGYICLNLNARAHRPCRARYQRSHTMGFNKGHNRAMHSTSYSCPSSGAAQLRRVFLCASNP